MREDRSQDMGEKGQNDVIENELVSVVEVPLWLIVVVLLQALQVVFCLPCGHCCQHGYCGLSEYIGLDLNRCLLTESARATPTTI